MTDSAKRSATPWPAPTAAGPVGAVVPVPGSKSATNRALVLAALADRPSVLRRPLRSRDTLLMADGLRAMGVLVQDGPDGSWSVTPPPVLRGGGAVDVGNAGTVMRFLLPLAALADGPVRFDGDPRSHERPIGALIGGLRALGAEVRELAKPGHFPLDVHGSGALPGGVVEIDSSASSQFVSALLLAGARFGQGVTVRNIGERLPSQPHIAMTVQMLRERGVEVQDAGPEHWSVAPGPIAGSESTIEPDLSNAGPFLAAALVTGGRVTVPDWPEHTTQPGDRLRELFTRMGARCEVGPDGLTLTGSGAVHGIEVDLGDEGELAPTLAAVAALADSPSRLSGIGHLRLHETDRLAALAKELGNLGGEVAEEPEALVITPRPLHGGLFATYEDHRLATAAAVLGLVVPGIEVENVATTEKTLPQFTERWAALLAGREFGAGPGSAA
ncbi:MAG TPA: 3-phosphoshikimate 1-carboxyvinyltransferase [Actinocrinis sp.]|nr:3-phosphoshikimate 1-carboxyvinyltransferase [Actinocrinis sp.]